MDTTAPVPGLAIAQQRAIPLSCNICPKKPKFSDLSHLLTHISSKAHLSTYYKIKVRAAADGPSRQLIEQYDIWYAEYKIEALMSDRLTQKEERMGRSRIKLEPRPARRVKKEPDSRSATLFPAAPFMDPASLLQHQNHPHLHPHPYGSILPMHMWAPNQYRFAPNEEEEDEPSSDVSSMPNKTQLKSGLPNPGSIDADDDESSKLKGVFWPGMGLFDAATPELKRKRNQKKDVSVNDRLAAISQEIERTEMIFSPLGSYRKSRVISGVPESDSDPLPGEETPPRPKKAKRAAARRKPLQANDPNLTSRSARAKAKKKGRAQPEPLEPSPDVFGEDDIEDQLTYEPQRNRRKKGSVYRDDEVSFDQPAAMTQLTAGYQQPPMFQPTAPMGFRPAEPTYMAAQSYYQFPSGYHGNPFTYDPSPLTTWDFYGHGMGPSIANPLFSGFEQASFNDEDDDEETISAPISGSDR